MLSCFCSLFLATLLKHEVLHAYGHLQCSGENYIFGNKTECCMVQIRCVNKAAVYPIFIPVGKLVTYNSAIIIFDWSTSYSEFRKFFVRESRERSLIGELWLATLVTERSRSFANTNAYWTHGYINKWS